MKGARVVLAGLALVGGLVLLEVGLRVQAEARADSFVGAAVMADDLVLDPLLVAWFKPNYRAPDGTTYDAAGFRLNGAPRPVPPQGAVVLLGGSTAYGWDATDDATIAAWLERRLRDRAPSTNVVNAGFPGLTTLDTLLVYQSKVRPLHPSVVVLLSGLNDLYYAVDWSPTQRLYWLNRTYEVALRARHDPALRPVVDAVDSIALRNCFTCYAFSSGLSRVYDGTGFPSALRAAQLLGEEPMGKPNWRAMDLTAWSIGELGRRVRADGGCLVVAWQPVAGVPHGARTPAEAAAVAQVAGKAPNWPATARRMFARLRRATAPVFEQGLAREVDLTGAFDGLDRAPFQDDGVHYAAWANDLLAAGLEQAVAASGCATS